jgi:hypothetical protein
MDGCYSRSEARRWRQLAAIVIAATACASVGGLPSESLEAGEVSVYPLATVVDAARQATLAADLEVSEVTQVDSNTWMTLASHAGSLFGGYGSIVRVIIHQLNADSVAVRIFTKKRLATDLSSRTDWGDEILLNLNRILAGAPGGVVPGQRPLWSAETLAKRFCIASSS